MRTIGYRRPFLGCAAALFAVALFAAEPSSIPKLSITSDRPSLHMKTGETITISGEMTEDGKPAAGRLIHFAVYRNDRVLEHGYLPGDQKIVRTVKAEGPGTITMRLRAFTADKKPIQNEKKRAIWIGTGALVDAEKILPAAPRPADFDEFWAAARKKLDEVPLKAVEVPFAINPKRPNAKLVDVFDVKVDCAGGAPVSAYLMVPKNAKPKSLPAIVYYDGAGVRSASTLTGYGHRALVLATNAHGIENGKPQEFYDDLWKKGRLKLYMWQNLDKPDQLTPEKIYFYGMYLRVMRALDYIKSRPEWNGRDLIVIGASQGGGQSIAAAVLDPQVSLCIAKVPATGDHAAVLAGRAPGWPRYCPNPKAPNFKKILDNVSYFDNVYFAPRIKCEIWLSTGMNDSTCVPTSVVAVFNSLPEKTVKHLYIAPTGDHLTTGNPPADTALDKLLKERVK